MKPGVAGDTETATQPLPVHHSRRFPLASLFARSILAFKKKPLFSKVCLVYCVSADTHMEHMWRSEVDFWGVSFLPL